MESTQKNHDQELIAMCQSGKDVGFTELYNKYAKSVYNSIARIVSHTAEAEDILQETFFIVFSKIDQLNGVKSVEAWMKRIAINRSISYLRKNRIVFSKVELADSVAEEDYDLEENKIVDYKVEEVRKVIEQLPESYRTIVSLYLFEDIPQKEIAKMLDISHSTVRTQYHRAKKKIMLSLKNSPYYV